VTHYRTVEAALPGTPIVPQTESTAFLNAPVAYAIFFSMSRDRLLPEGVSKVHPRFGTPCVTTIITSVVVALVAGLTPINVVGEMTSIATLFAFVVVCCAVIMRGSGRPAPAEASWRRPFLTPARIRVSEESRLRGPE
jgi:hypothetical protein